MAETPEFLAAAETMRTDASIKLDSSAKLELYALYKQGCEGECRSSRPGMLDFVNRAKWDSWHALGNMPQAEAQSRYVALVGRLVPDWRERAVASVSATPSSPSAAAEALASALLGEGDSDNEVEAMNSSSSSSQRHSNDTHMGPVVSTMYAPEAPTRDEDKTLFDLAKEGNNERLSALLKTTPKAVDAQDEDGMSLLSWACDRGLESTAQLLLDNGADINIRDISEQTPLHYAAACDYAGLVRLLLQRGADATLVDEDGLRAEQVCDSAEVRALFAAHKSSAS
eukprot:m.147298 g.147298  ORF g.147298 m.147298 type:complete len:284 (-) comp16825_c3_seq5:1322-2173(-)